MSKSIAVQANLGADPSATETAAARNVRRYARDGGMHAVSLAATYDASGSCADIRT